MQEITLENIPQQKFGISLGDSQWTLSFRTANNASDLCTLVDIDKDGETVIHGLLCAPNSALLPYPYMDGGNFVFVCGEGQYPNYENFGENTHLYWLDKSDLESLLQGEENA